MRDFRYKLRVILLWCCDVMFRSGEGGGGGVSLRDLASFFTQAARDRTSCMYK